MNELPHGWRWATLRDLCDRASKWDPRQFPGKTFSYIDISAIDGQCITAVRTLDGAKAPSRARQLVRAGDTILSTVRTYLRNTALVSADFDEATVSTGFCVLRPTAAIDAHFLFYRVVEDGFVEGLSARQTGTSYPAVRDADVFEQPVALPPLAEQRRIVSALEEHLSRLDAAERWMTSVPRRLEVVGRAALAQRVQSDRWPRVRLAEVGDGTRHALAIGPFGSNLKVSDYRETGVPLVFVRNIRARNFGGTGTRYVSHQKAEELAAHHIRGGDVLITKMGDPPGDATVYPSVAPDAIITADCIKISVGTSFDPDFVAFAIEAPEQRRQVLAATKGVAQKKVSLGRFKEVTIPAPELDEQRRIARELNEFFSGLESQYAALNIAQRRARALRRSVLATAFRGELVPQDPSDEPASVLLKRIAAERAGAPKPTRRQKEKTPA